MTGDDIGIARIGAALHPVDAVPAGRAWNLDEIEDLLPAAAPVPAAVLVGLVPRARGLQVLLTRRTDVLRHHAGQVSFPGGRIEADDIDAAAAAIRETGEEIGVDGNAITPLGWLDPLATVTGFTVLPLVASITPDYLARPDPREVAEVFEVPLAFLMAAGNLRSVHIDWRGRPRNVLEFANHGAPAPVGVHIDWRGRPRNVLEFANHGAPARRIWGATASILLNLRQRLEQA